MLTTVDAQCYGPKRTGLLVAKNRALSLVIREGLLIKMVSLAMAGGFGLPYLGESPGKAGP